MARIKNEVREAVLAKLEPVTKEVPVTEQTTEVEQVVPIISKKNKK